MATLFQFADLAMLTESAPFDGMAFGSFTDMLGRDVDLKASDGAEFIVNTLDAIEATRTESGELVGLPIDAGDHDKGDAAGWIVGAELVGDIIRLIPKWTEIGREMITKGIRRFFSPTVNLADKVILGGALVNWPATTDATGKVLLRPIELSSNIHTYEVDMSETKEVIEEVEVATPDESQPEPATTNETADAIAELRAEIRADVRAELRAEYEAQLTREREAAHISEFAQTMQTGGLPIPFEEVEAFLGSLNPAQREGAESILTRTVEAGLTPFNELGHSKRMRGVAELGSYDAGTLRTFVAEGGSIGEFFEVNPELGDRKDYDLSEYEEKE